LLPWRRGIAVLAQNGYSGSLDIGGLR